jgi:hypothetical protein
LKVNRGVNRAAPQWRAFIGTGLRAKLPKTPGEAGSRGAGFMRFFLAVVVVVILALIGLFIYGQMLEPETRQIEQEAVRSGDA